MTGQKEINLSKPQSASTAYTLITGASSGIGEALAQCFAQAGHDLVLVARSGDKLLALASGLRQRHGVKVVVAPSDLSRPEAAAELGRMLGRKRCSIDLLVNCAGVLEQGAFGSLPALAHQQIIALNIAGLTAMLSEFLPGLLEQARQGRPGRVLNVASIAAFQPVPMLASYAASKAYVLSLSESLAEELKGSGVSVTALCPGITATNMLSSATSANAQLSRIPAFLVGDVAEVARQGFEACMRGDAICVPGALNRAAMLASRSTPKWLVRRLGGIMGRAAL